MYTLNVLPYSKYWPEDGLIKPKQVTKTMYFWLYIDVMLRMNKPVHWITDFTLRRFVQTGFGVHSKHNDRPGGGGPPFAGSKQRVLEADVFVVCSKINNKQNRRTTESSIVSLSMKDDDEWNRTVLGKWPIWCIITLHTMFIIIILHMFRATLCSSSGGRIILIQHLV